MKKVSIILFLLLIASVSKVQAVPAAPSSICEITGRITKINSYPDSYIVYAEIDSIRMVEKIGSFQCDQEAQNRYNQGFFLLRPAEYTKRPVAVGDEIRAKVQLQGDEVTGGNYLFDVRAKTAIDYGRYRSYVVDHWYYFLIGILIVIIVVLMLTRRRGGPKPESSSKL